MNCKHFFIVLISAISSISASSAFTPSSAFWSRIRAYAASIERLKNAMNTCKALVNTVEYGQCMKDQNILSFELITKAYKVKDDEVINYEEIIADAAVRSLAFRNNFAAYCSAQSDLTLYNEFMKNQKIPDIFFNELEKLNYDEVEVIGYQKFIIDVYKNLIVNARSGVPFPFELLYIVDTEDFTSAVSATFSLTAESLKIAMNNCKLIENKSEYVECMKSQGIDDSFILESAYNSKDLSIATIVYYKMLELDFKFFITFGSERKAIEVMNSCQNLSDKSEYKQCLIDQGIDNEHFHEWAFKLKDIDPIGYNSMIIQAEKKSIYSSAFQHMGVPSLSILINLNYNFIPKINLPKRHRAGPGPRTADYAPSRPNFEFYNGTTKIERITYG